MKDYRTYLRAAGVKPLKGKLRTSKPRGAVEIVWDPKAGDWVKFIHEGEESNVVPLRRMKRAVGS